MRLARRLTTSAALLAAALGPAGCNDALGPAGDLRVEASVAPAQIRAGEELTVTVTVTNDGGRVRWVDTGPCVDLFTVTAADGTPVTLPPQYCILIAMLPTELRPGGRIALTGTWRGQVYSERQGRAAPAPPGEYVVRAAVYAVRDGDREGSRERLAAAPVTVRVLP